MNYFYKDGLESERLRTRFLNADDILPWSDFFEADTVAYIPDFGFKTTLERSEHWINRQLNRYANKEFGLQALIDKQSGECVGQCGLLLQQQDGKAEVEVGYHIYKKHWGKGYAPEAAKLFIDFAFKNNITDSVVSIIHINNLKSQRVAEKNGLAREKQSRLLDLEVFIYRINK